MIDQLRLRSMTPADLATFGLQDVAYIRPTIAGDGATHYAICAADGTEMAVLTDRDVAIAAVRQHDMEPVSVH